MLSQARSRSKGPLSDQVADAPYPRGQCRSWVEPCGSIAVPGTAGIGATLSPERVPTKVRNPPRADLGLRYQASDFIVRHQVEPDPAEMAERYGRERLVCSQCGSRKVDMVVTATDRKITGAA